MNRLYLDALSLRISGCLTRMAYRLNASKLFPYGATLTALIAASSVSAWPQDLSLPTFVQFLAVASLLPLFPLHGLYLAALTRSRYYIAVCFATLLPTVGLYGLIDLLREVPAELLTGIRTLALVSALYGSLKASVQSRVIPTLAYASLSFYSVLWWYMFGTRTLSPQAAVYFIAVVLSIGGILLAGSRLRARYGDLALERIGGLAHPMPRFATLLALLTMAAVGLPPFGLFSGYIGMLLHPSMQISWELSIILLTWFAPSVYLFRMMQRLLFGPHRTVIRYEDLRQGEIASLLILLLILLAVGFLPYGLFDLDLLSSGYRSTLEMTTSWIK
jgi:NADH-quinone oxidoreductase subunit M